jgi:hypothetical protein
MAMSCGLGGPGSIPGSARCCSSSQRPGQLWDPPSLLSSGYRRLFPRAQSSRGVKLTTHLHLLPRSRNVELYLPPSYVFMGLMLNQLSTGTALPFKDFKFCMKYRGSVIISLYYSKSDIHSKSLHLVFHSACNILVPLELIKQIRISVM